jgi:L-asparagine transporter-like permease
MILFYVVYAIFILPIATIGYFMSLNLTYFIACFAVIWHQIAQFRGFRKAIREKNLDVPFFERKGMTHFVRLFTSLFIFAVAAENQSPLLAVSFVAIVLFLDDVFHEVPRPQRTGLPQSWINRKTK